MNAEQKMKYPAIKVVKRNMRKIDNETRVR